MLINCESEAGSGTRSGTGELGCIRNIERGLPVGPSGRNRVRQSYWHGSHRAPPSPGCRLRASGNGEAGIESWTSPDPLMRCAIVTVNVPSIRRIPLEDWMWKKHKIRIRGTEPSKIRLCLAYYLQRHEIERFLLLFDQYKAENKVVEWLSAE